MPLLTCSPASFVRNHSTSSRFSSRFRVAIAANLQTPRFLFLAFWRRHSYFQHTVVERRLRFLNVHAFRNRNTPEKFSVAALAAKVAFTLLVVFVLALAFDRNSVLRELDIHIVFG